MVWELRNKLKKYKEFLFILYMVLFGALVSGGFNSADMVYKVLFGICIVCWLFDLALTDFKLKEILILLILFGLLGITFITNREKTLILLAMAISGAKDVNLDKMFSWALGIKILVSLELYGLVLAGFITNHLDKSVKSGKEVFNYCFGYYCPNHAFMNIFFIALLFVLIFRERFKWYGYLLLTALVGGAYMLFSCRTGMLVWVVFILCIALYCLVRNSSLKKAYLYLFTSVPALMYLMTFILVTLVKKKNRYALRIDELLHDRLSFIVKHPLNQLNLFGHFPRQSFDNGYYHLLYNYGYIFTLLAMVAYVALIIYLIKKEKDYEVIVLGCNAIYIFMEYAAMSVCWSITLVLFSLLIFEKGKEKEKEEKCQIG